MENELHFNYSKIAGEKNVRHADNYDDDKKTINNGVGQFFKPIDDDKEIKKVYTYNRYLDEL